MEATIGIKEKHRAEIAQVLSVLLADEVILNTKTRAAHWNVSGMDFHSMHLFFGEQYNAIDAHIDEIAERIRSIGHFSPGSLKEFLQLTRLTEKKEGGTDSSTWLKQLLSDHESIIFYLREQIPVVNDDWKDLGTGDFLTGLLEWHEKTAWMIRAHLS